MKKIISLALALMMVLSLAVVAFAENGSDPATGSIEIHGSQAGHVFKAYQLISASSVTYDDQGRPVVNGVDWGSSIVNTEDVHNALAPASGTQAAGVASTWVDLIDGLEGIILRNYIAHTFKTNYLKLDDPVATSARSDGGAVVLSGLPIGYYLVLDDPDGADVDENTGDAFADYILRVVPPQTDGNVVVNISETGTNAEGKVSAPTVVKKVKENVTVNGHQYSVNEKAHYENYGDVADYNIGESIPYVLVGTLPSNYHLYSNNAQQGGNGYHYEFVDILSDGLSIDSHTVDLKIYALDPEGNKATIPTANCIVEYSWTENGTACHGVHVVIPDLTQYSFVEASSKIVVEYNAKLNDNAKIVGGNENEVHLVYSNDPRKNGGGVTGKTPVDKNVVYTYALDVTKRDAVPNRESKHLTLAGSKFALTNAASQPVNVKGDGGVYYVTSAASATTASNIVESVEGGKILIKGLDRGEYYLTETEAPAGYVLLSQPIKFTIAAEINYGAEYASGNAPLTGLKITADHDAAHVDQDYNYLSTGTVQMIVDNTFSSMLPVTGGMGTTLFYILGAMMVVCSGVILITRKRMAK